MERPLSGIRVVGLADMCADVIKIERSSGNVWRETAKASCPEKFTDAENPSYDINNTGKKHIVLSMKTEDGIHICHRLLGSADGFVTKLRASGVIN